MNIMEVNFAVAPDAVMPEPLQVIVLYLSIAALAGFALYGARMCFKYKTLLPLLFLVAGFCTIGLEPVVTFLGHAIHPRGGQIALFESLDRLIPWHVAILYSFYFGGVYIWLFPRMVARSLTPDYIWKSYFVTCVCAYLIEIIPVSNGLWVYYGDQALWLWKGSMPLVWTFLNVACIFMPIMLIYKLLPLLTGVRQLLVIPLSASGAFMAHLGAGFPYYLTMNSDWGPMAIQVGGVMSVSLALFIVWITTRFVAEEAPNV